MAEVVTVAVPSSQLLPHAGLRVDLDLTFMSVPAVLPGGVDAREVADALVRELVNRDVYEAYMPEVAEDPAASLLHAVAALLAQPGMPTRGRGRGYRNPVRGFPSWPPPDFEAMRPAPAFDRQGVQEPGRVDSIYRELAEARVWGVRNSPLFIKSLLDLGHTGVGAIAFVQGNGVWVGIAVTATAIFVTYIVIPVAREVGAALASRAGHWALDFGRPKRGANEQTAPGVDDDPTTPQ